MTYFRSKKYKMHSDFSNPVNESFKKYLALFEENANEELEHVDVFCDKVARINWRILCFYSFLIQLLWFYSYPTNFQVKESKPKIGEMYFGTPVDKYTLDQNFLKNGRSTYEISYCDLG